MYLHGGIAMNTREMERMMDQRELKVAECVKTYFNLFGKQPEVKEMTNSSLYRITFERKNLCKWQHSQKQVLFIMGFGTDKGE